MNSAAFGPGTAWKQNNLLLQRSWPWHLLFWLGYCLFRLYIYYITVRYYHPIFLQYMLFAEAMLVSCTYFTLWLYKRLFAAHRQLIYFLAGTLTWILYLYTRTAFQFYYLKNAPGFKANTYLDIFLNNITVVIAFFLFVTACKYFKDGYIRQQFESQQKQAQLVAEVNNLKSQIAPHFLFNTLNNLYGLAVEKNDNLPELMLRLSDLLRHSLYETQKTSVAISDEIRILASYIDLETLRLEDSLKLDFDNSVPGDAEHQIAPLILIVFVENAFKHAKLVQSDAVNIYIKTGLQNEWFTLVVKNNFNKEIERSAHGIGLANVRRRLEVLYPNGQHRLTVTQDEDFFTVHLQLKLAVIANNS